MRPLVGLPDADLVAALRADADGAVAEFDARFRPILEAYARRARIPRGEWSASITDLLDDEIIRLAVRSVAAPDNMAAYLIRALRHRYLNSIRAAERRERRHTAAAENQTGEWVVTSLCSEDALRSSAGPEQAVAPTRAVLERLADELRAEITEEEHSILMWISHGASHVEIAKWLGSSYEASTKRIWRLCQRLRTRATDRAATYPASERSEFERFLRRVGDPPRKGRAQVSA